jgi:hypothetical protein
VGPFGAPSQTSKGSERYAQPDHWLRPLGVPVPNDPWYPSQWNLKRVSAPAGWNIYPNCLSGCQGANANGPLVAVIDTGVDASHPDSGTA